ncbi:MAG: serine/threonine protein kinase, partial [candidate division Zixibacteria bacterium]|nr:serine/threonine protein kinase [candidate division Zixibacteria bacterium]
MLSEDDKTRTFVPLNKDTMVSHYRIVEKIGAGGMGEVYLAEDTKLNRRVALKFLPVHACQDADRRSRFTREAQAAAKLNHPNIVTIYEVSEFSGRPFFAMEHIDGKSLRDLIKRKGMPLSQIIDIAIQLCEGLQEAHARGIIHRDIKPSNISCDGKGHCKILDFGLAAVRGSDQLTKTGSTLGTASYMSPEQARGEKTDQRSDLWSFGVVLYEMVTGKAPFQGENEASILLSVVNNEPEPVQSAVPDVSPELVHIIRRALEKDPADRYKTAEDMLIDLKRLKKDTSRQGIVTVSGGKRRLRRRRNMIIAASLLVVLGVAGYLYYSNTGVELNPNFTSRWIEIPYSNLGWA